MEFFAQLPTLRTERLILRPWRASDLLPFAQMNADPKVMEFYPSILRAEESDVLLQKIQKDAAEKKYGFWAIEAPGVADFIGYVGLNYWNLEMSFAPCIDVGWRLGAEFWGKGYATEGAKEALRFGFEECRFSEIVAMATINNFRSHSVMRKLGMTHDPKENFHHPKLPQDHALSLRVLYRLSRSLWLQTSSNF